MHNPSYFGSLIPIQLTPKEKLIIVMTKKGMTALQNWWWKVSNLKCSPYEKDVYQSVTQAMHSGKENSEYDFCNKSQTFYDPLHTVYWFCEWPTLCFVFSCDGSPEDYEPPCFPIMYPDGSECAMFTRSAATCQTDSENVAPREQLNTITSFIDGSQIYGSSSEVVENLRDLNCKYLVLKLPQNVVNF